MIRPSYVDKPLPEEVNTMKVAIVRRKLGVENGPVAAAPGWCCCTCCCCHCHFSL